MLASETLATGLIRTFLCGNKFKLKKDRLGPSRIGQRNEFVPRIGKPRPQCQHVWESRIFRNIPIPLLDSLTGSSAGRGILHRFCRHLFPVVREFFRSP